MFLKLVFGMNQSLDGYVDHMAFAPGPTLFRHFIEEAQRVRAVSTVAGCMRSCAAGTTIILNGIQRNRPAAAWRRNQPKWVVSRLLESVGPTPACRG